MNGSEAAGDLVSIQTPLFLSCKSCSRDAKLAFICIRKAKRFLSKQGHRSLAAIHRPGH